MGKYDIPAKHKLGYLAHIWSLTKDVYKNGIKFCDAKSKNIYTVLTQTGIKLYNFRKILTACIN